MKEDEDESRLMTHTGLGWRLLQDVRVYWRMIMIIVAPLALLPLPILMKSSEAACGYVLALMAVYWLCELVPLAVTAMFPIVLLPALGIVTAQVVAGKYIADATLTFMAGMMIALAIEKSELHRRFALGLLLSVDAKPASIVIGFILPSWFLSMWISNTAATSMMVTVSQSVLDRIAEGIELTREEKERELLASYPSMIETPPAALTEVGTNEEETYFGQEAPLPPPPPPLEFKLEKLSNTSHTEHAEVKDALGHTEHAEVKDALGHTEHAEVKDTLGHTEYAEVKDTLDHIEHAEVKDAPLTRNSDHTMPSYMPHVTIDCEGEKSSYKEQRDVIAREHQRSLDTLKNFSKMLCLSVAYASNIGGLATLTGTPTNLFVAQYANQIFLSNGVAAPISYTTWIFYGLPNSVVCLVFMWAWLQLLFLGPRSFCDLCCSKKDKVSKNSQLAIGETIRTEYEKLGPISFAEISVIVSLVLVVVLWFARDPGFAHGYDVWFKEGYVSDAAPAILVAIVLFIFPSKVPTWMCLRKRSEPAVSHPALLDWKTVSTKLPWGPVIIIGGGYALAEGCNASGLSKLIGTQLQFLEALPVWAMVFLIIAVVTFFTEITSNVVVVSIISPILGAMAEAQGINPLYLLMPACMACTCAFMLPVATPPNAVVFAYGHLTVLDMVKAGFILNTLCILIIMMGIQTWGRALFDIDVLPWAVANTTLNNMV